jgi:hypothetical protein
VKGLLNLYPAWWRERYGVEMAALLDDLPHRSRAKMTFDLLRGALDARFALAKESAMPSITRGSLRPSILIGLAVWLALSIDIYLTNVVFPTNNDDDTLDVLLCYVGIWVALAIVGYLAGRRGASLAGVVICGVAAGVIIGFLTAGTFVFVDNVWLDIVARQPQKITGLAESGGGSMRAYINRGLIGAFVILPLMVGFFGAAFSLVGAFIAERRQSRAVTRSLN